MVLAWPNSCPSNNCAKVQMGTIAPWHGSCVCLKNRQWLARFLRGDEGDGAGLASMRHWCPPGIPQTDINAPVKRKYFILLGEKSKELN